MTDGARLSLRVLRNLLVALDRERGIHRESRSALVRRLLEAALRDGDERAEIEQYVAGYRAQPQTEDEFGWSDPVALERFSL